MFGEVNGLKSGTAAKASAKCANQSDAIDPKPGDLLMDRMKPG